MAKINIDAISEKIKEGTSFISDKKSTFADLFSSIKKIVPGAGKSYSASKPVKAKDGTVEIKAGEKSVKSSGGFAEKIMNKKILVPVLVIAGIYFGLRKLIKI